MWLFTLFDLPAVTPEEKKLHAKFRKNLQKQGFTMLQFSVYARYFASEERADIQREKVKAVLPPEGQVRLMAITDRQFGKMEVFYGKKRQPTEDPPMQMSFF